MPHDGNKKLRKIFDQKKSFVKKFSGAYYSAIKHVLLATLSLTPLLPPPTFKFSKNPNPVPKNTKSRSEL